MSRASDFAALAAQMKYTDSEGDTLAEAWIEEVKVTEPPHVGDTERRVWVKLLGVDKLSCEEANRLGRWLLETTEEK